MSSSRKRRYQQKLENMKYIEDQIKIRTAWVDSLQSYINLMMFAPRYNTSFLLEWNGQ